MSFRERDIANKFRFPVGSRDAVYTDVDDDGARLDPVTTHHLRLPDGCDQYVGAAQDRRKITGFRMSNRYRATLGQQQRRHRFADDIGASEHDRLGACQIRQYVAQQQQTAIRRARDQRLALSATPQLADILGMESVNVFARIDGVDHPLRIDVLWQGQLHQNTIDPIVSVELGDHCQKLGFAGRRR